MCLAICSLTESTLNDADFRIGGDSRKFFAISHDFLHKDKTPKPVGNPLVVGL